MSRRRGVLLGSLNEKYLAWAKGQYSESEYICMRSALGVVDSIFWFVPARMFGPVRLRQVREAMIAKGWNRIYVSHQVHRVCAVFRWAVSWEILPIDIYAALKTVEPLKRFRTPAPDPEPVGPVDIAHVEAVRPHISLQLWDVAQLQLLTGSRPGEILPLRPLDIDRTKKIWRSNLVRHKTGHRGKTRTIFLGPRAQLILQKWMLRPGHEFLFSPREAEDHRIAIRTANRKTPLEQGNKAMGHRRAVGGCYTTHSYRRAIHRACQKAKIPPWHPNQLRHTAATEISQKKGPIAASLVLGHSSAMITQKVYVKRDTDSIMQTVYEMG
jgi:integrase